MFNLRKKALKVFNKEKVKKKLSMILLKRS